MYENKVTVSFPAAHRLLNYNGECSNNHGHTFVVVIYFSGDITDSLGMIQDFKEVKETVKTIIDENFNHATLSNKYDVHYIDFCVQEEQKLYTFDGNPTAENISKEIYKLVKPLIKNLSKVEVYEGDGKSASYRK